MRSDWDLPDGFFRGASIRPLGFAGAPVEISGYRFADQSLEMARSHEFSWAPGMAFEIHSGVEAPVLAAHWVTGTALEATLPPIAMRLATTRGTNALLERAGSATALFITRGFADLLQIGTQQRPDLFALAVDKRRPLYEAVVEVEERVSGQGEILEALNLESVRREAADLLGKGIEVAAVALLNSYRNPEHERILARELAAMGFAHVSSSAELAPLIKILPRAETAVVNAYLSQVIGDYLSSVRRSAKSGPLHVLTSAGSLVRSSTYLPKDSLLSGPAGGVVGAASIARESGFQRSLAFDMGGTSTDVSRYDGELDYRFETEVGDARLLSPSLAIETVAAGGGSICDFDGRQLKVGPESAGADPGPACYGAGGPLTLTDVNLLLGRLDPARFEIPMVPSAAEKEARRLIRSVEEERGADSEMVELLSGLLRIANERMAEAVRRISIRQGYRPSEYALVAFGGAGGQHACALAEILDISSILVPEDAGLLSAVGLGRARMERICERQVLRPLEEVLPDLSAVMGEMSEEARSRVREEGVASEDVVITGRKVYLRLQGQEASLALEFEDDGQLAVQFARVYRDHYGYLPEAATIEVEAIRVIGASLAPVDRSAEESPGKRQQSGASDRRRVYLGGKWQDLAVFDRASLSPGGWFPGPALVFESHCATLVGEEWRASIDRTRCLVLRRERMASR